MLKKMMLLALSVGALLAFAAPAAQANVALLENGAALEEGEGVTLTSENLVTTVGAGRTLQCKKVTFHFEVVTNGPEHVVLGKVGGGTGNNEGTTEGCTATIAGLGTFPAVITDPTVPNEVTINTTGTGTFTAQFTSDVAALGLNNCTLEGNVHVQGTDNTDILHVGPSKLTRTAGSPENCSPEGSIAGSFTAETSNGTPVVIDQS